MRLPWLVAVALAVVTCCARADSTRPLAPITNGAAHVVPPQDPDRFTFVVGGDNRSAGRGIPEPPTAARIFEEEALLHPAFTLWTGDAIYGSDDSLPEAHAEYVHFREEAARSGAPLYCAPGNHEVFERREMEELFEHDMGPLYGSFDFGHSHFIALDTSEVGRNGGLSEQQMQWLRADLEANRHAAHIFAFMHYPLFPKEAKSGFKSADQRGELHELFVKYGVRNVFCGHEHLFYRAERDGVVYWVSGGAGAPADAAPEGGGFQHYVVMTVDGPRVTGVVVQPWRLFALPGPVRRDASASEVVANYNYTDLRVRLELPLHSNGIPFVSASWTYKGGTHTIAATVERSERPGVVAVWVVVPAGRAALITVAPQPRASAPGAPAAAPSGLAQRRSPPAVHP